MRAKIISRTLEAPPIVMGTCRVFLVVVKLSQLDTFCDCNFSYHFVTCSVLADNTFKSKSAKNRWKFPTYGTAKLGSGQDLGK